jgi:hypothetical protein
MLEQGVDREISFACRVLPDEPVFVAEHGMVNKATLVNGLQCHAGGLRGLIHVSFSRWES